MTKADALTVTVASAIAVKVVVVVIAASQRLGVSWRRSACAYSVWCVIVLVVCDDMVER